MSPSFPPRALQFGIIPTCQVLFFPTFHSSMQGVERLSQESRVPQCRIRGKCAAFRAATVEILSIPKRRIEEVLQMLADSDTLIVTELSRLGRSTAEVIALVNELVAHNIRVIILKQNLDIFQHDMSSKMVITLFSLFAELERDLMSLRTKEALAAKKQQGKTLGKPRGTIQKSKFDADLERIKDHLKLGLSVRKIATLLGYKNHLALNISITKRQLREHSS